MTPPSDVDDTHGRRSILRNLSNVYQVNFLLFFFFIRSEKFGFLRFFSCNIVKSDTFLSPNESLN